MKATWAQAETIHCFFFAETKAMTAALLITQRIRPDYLFALLAVISINFLGCSFAQSRQQSTRSVRERSGQAFFSSATGMGNFTLTDEEKRLVVLISNAGKEGDWIAAKSALKKYTGDSPAVYTAALHAAFRCRQYREGSVLYEQCRQRCKQIHEPVYTQALRIFGKLGEKAMVHKVWAEALETGHLDPVLASARIAAAADQGDVETAAEVLDLMEAKGVPINELHMSSAIRACWGWGHQSYKAAKYFYELCPRLGVKPNLIVFTCLVGAYDPAPLEDITSTYRAMRQLKIAANIVFAETYLVSLLSKPKELKLQDPESARKWLGDKPVKRLQAAQEALDDFDRDGVSLTALSQTLKKGLKRLNL